MAQVGHYIFCVAVSFTFHKLRIYKEIRIFRKEVIEIMVPRRMLNDIKSPVS